MSKLKPIFASLLATMMVAGCGLKVGGVDIGRVAQVGKRAFTTAENISPKEEFMLGAKMTAVLLGGAPLLPNEALQRHVNLVGRWIASQSERPNLPWTFAVIQSRDINAFAAPGGFVLISSGLLSLLDGDDELAAVLAHEIAHVNDKHHLKALDKTKGLDIIGQLALVAADAYNENHQTSQVARRNQKIAKGLLSATQTLYVNGLSKADEFEADGHGLVLMTRAGFDPYAMVSVLQKIEALDPRDSRIALWLSTHPKTPDRIEAIAKKIEPLLSQGIARMSH